MGGCSAVGDRRIHLPLLLLSLCRHQSSETQRQWHKDWVVIAKFAVVLLMISNDVRVISSRAAVGEDWIVHFVLSFFGDYFVDAIS